METPENSIFFWRVIAGASTCLFLLAVVYCWLVYHCRYRMGMIHGAKDMAVEAGNYISYERKKDYFKSFCEAVDGYIPDGSLTEEIKWEAYEKFYNS